MYRTAFAAGTMSKPGTSQSSTSCRAPGSYAADTWCGNSSGQAREAYSAAEKYSTTASGSPSRRAAVISPPVALVALPAAEPPVRVGVRHRHGLPESAGVERLQLLGLPEPRRREPRRATPGGQQPRQLPDARLELLRAPARLRLPRLPVRLAPLPVLPRHVPLVRPLLPLPLALLLHQRPLPGLLLTLLLPLGLGPDAYQSTGAATHVDTFPPPGLR